MTVIDEARKAIARARGPIDRPIIFSAPMILALLAGQKTMTRRLRMQKRKTAPTNGSYDHYLVESPWARVKPGDRLWVKETFAEPNDQVVIYRANWREDAKARGMDNIPLTDKNIRWRPSIYMPRAYSRLTLTVTAAKIERLQAITAADCIAEGIRAAANSATIDCDTPNPRDEFRRLWESLHGASAWQDDPECVALSFSIEKINIDAPKVAA